MSRPTQPDDPTDPESSPSSAPDSSPAPTPPVEGPSITSEFSVPPDLPRPERRTLPDPFGRYRIVRLLGEGGMGTVYLAHDTQLDRLVALKVPQFKNGDPVRLRERFLREARSMRMLHRCWKERARWPRCCSSICWASPRLPRAWTRKRFCSPSTS